MSVDAPRPRGSPTTTRRRPRVPCTGSVATAHKLLHVAYAVLRDKEPYEDPNTHYENVFVKRNAPRWLRMRDKHGVLKEIITATSSAHQPHNRATQTFPSVALDTDGPSSDTGSALAVRRPTGDFHRKHPDPPQPQGRSVSASGDLGAIQSSPHRRS